MHQPKLLGAAVAAPNAYIGKHVEADHLLIDAKNALYTAIYSVKANRKHSIRYHYFVALLRQITAWMNFFRPKSVHVFWDAPRHTVWRRKLLPTYKDRSDSQYVENIMEDMIRTTVIAKQFFDVMNVRQYDKKNMEADDLIYSAIVNLHPQSSVIVSSDGDMLQIPFVYNSCRVYDHSKKKERDVPTINPVMQKALCGDNSDNISGYTGIGPKKSAAMLADLAKLEEFLNVAGRDTYLLNLLLVDLSLNPKLLNNRAYIQRILSGAVNFDKTAIIDLTRKYNINGIMQNFNDLFPPFTKLV